MLNASVLIVDDDQIVRFIHRKLVALIEPNISCYEAVNGRDALRVISLIAQPVLTIILLDIDMPVMNGFEFIEAFQKIANNNQTEIVMVSSSQNSCDINRSRMLGIRQFISKPLTISCLKSIINTYASPEFNYLSA